LYSPADQYSDLDLVMIVEDPGYYLTSQDWIREIGSSWVSFCENTSVGGSIERRVLFEDALDVDIVLFSEKEIGGAVERSDVQGILNRGYRVLVDKIGLTGKLPPVSVSGKMAAPPSESEFLNLINDFWYHTVWSAKKLLRGELWAAKSCVDSYMKRMLLTMIEWHARAVKGWDYDTWHDGRFLDSWADPGVKQGLSNAFAHYNKSDVARALEATMNLFRTLAAETAGVMGYAYPSESDCRCTEWVKDSLAEI
jgi:aminoglycoside 6-adenylyltransferase